MNRRNRSNSVLLASGASVLVHLIVGATVWQLPPIEPARAASFSVARTSLVMLDAPPLVDPAPPKPESQPPKPEEKPPVAPQQPKPQPAPQAQPKPVEPPEPPEVRVGEDSGAPDAKTFASSKSTGEHSGRESEQDQPALSVNAGPGGGSGTPGVPAPAIAPSPAVPPSPAQPEVSPPEQPKPEAKPKPDKPDPQQPDIRDDAAEPKPAPSTAPVEIASKPVREPKFIDKPSPIDQPGIDKGAKTGPRDTKPAPEAKPAVIPPKPDAPTPRPVDPIDDPLRDPATDKPTDKPTKPKQPLGAPPKGDPVPLLPSDTQPAKPAPPKGVGEEPIAPPADATPPAPKAGERTTTDLPPGAPPSQLPPPPTPAQKLEQAQPPAKLDQTITTGAPVPATEQRLTISTEATKLLAIFSPLAPMPLSTPNIKPQPATPARPPSPPAPQRPATAGNNGGGGGGSPGDASDKDVDIFSREFTGIYRNGSVIGAQGLEIKTRRPEFSLITRTLSSPRPVVVKITFQRDGTVRVAKIEESSGYVTDVDEPILNAVYDWRAVGKALKELPTDRDAVIVLKVTIVLR